MSTISICFCLNSFSDRLYKNSFSQLENLISLLMRLIILYCLDICEMVALNVKRLNVNNVSVSIFQCRKFVTNEN